MEWLGPEGVNVSNKRILEIMNIQRSVAGIYTCVATHTITGATMNSIVNIIVQCECHDVSQGTVTVYRDCYGFVYILPIHLEIHFLLSVSSQFDF